MELILHPRWNSEQHRATVCGEQLVFTKRDPVVIETEEQLEALRRRIGKSLAIARLVETNSGETFYEPDLEMTDLFLAGEDPPAEGDEEGEDPEA